MEKLNWFYLTSVIMDGTVLEEKSSFKMLGFCFSSKLDRGSYILSITKSTSKKIGALICPVKFFSPEIALYLYKSIIRSCTDTVVISGFVVPVAIWNC